jgi:tRNA-modifying protein YgfZ
MSTNDVSVCLLQPLGLMSLRGPDTLRFLQGQLSNDIGALQSPPAPDGRLLRAGLHNPQGRTLALLGLVTEDADSVLAVLPRELVAATIATLRRYVLRAKVCLADASDAYVVQGLLPGAPVPTSGICVEYHGGRRLLITRAAALTTARPWGAWHALDVAAGLPQVYTATAGQFVAQMLNLDCIGALSFNKGCYTGQEVIARAHYRGRVKRRMQRFISHGPLALGPGDSGELPDGMRFRVVDSTQHADGRCEFLAVAALPGAVGAAGAGAGGMGLEGDGTGAPATSAPPLRVEAARLSLPYSLPD